MSYAERVNLDALRTKYEMLIPILTERSRRLWAATEAMSLGHGGIASVVRATGISRSTISRGIRELRSGEPLDPERIRHPGAGRKRAIDKDPTLLTDLEALLEATTAGMPDAPMRWTSKSVRKLASELQSMGHSASHTLVSDLLREQGYTLQANKKTREGTQHPDRDAQFQYLNEQVTRYQKQGNPVISVDTKKKELIGDFKTPDESGDRKEAPNACAYTTLSSPNRARQFPTGSMT